ncbi:Membrane protein involved in the export of O-antigen and teichoic acid [Halobacillus karajensis]|uniref:lipopolysaccharide biosynthesis protein n=1 Tax=Halobacillus karajensis TaxID=195088 RepID=UPI0008A806FC|nr:oligosaccharide flippase family protein [Halobacillus karajensis]SEH43961.1 Membrane protein involved in the export of O-antigen and teichoic acid [Halobacillus karajensis]
MKNNLIRKFFSFSYGSWVGLFIGLITTIVTTRILTPEELGKASMFTLLITVSMIISTFGTDQAFIRFYYEEDESNRGRLLYSSLKIPIIILLILSMIIIACYKPITDYLFNESSILLSIFIIIGVIFQTLNRFGKLVLRMQQKGNMYSLIEITSKLLPLIFIIILSLSLASDYKIMIYSLILTLIISFMLQAILGKNLWKVEHKRYTSTKYKPKDIIKYGSPFVFTVLITWIFQSFDRIAIKQWNSFEELGIYTAAYKIVGLVVALQSAFSSFWTPVSFERFNKYPKDTDFFSEIMKIMTFFMSILAVLTILSKDLFVFLLGGDYQSASLVIPFLIFMPIFYTISEITVVGINFLKKTLWHVPIAIVSCLTNIIGNWFLVPEHGAIGAAIATAVSYLCFFILRTYLSTKMYPVNYELKKFYIVITTVLSFALFSLSKVSDVVLYIIGAFIIAIIVFIYYKDLKGFFNKINR